MKVKIAVLVLFLLGTSLKMDKPAYQLFDVRGKKTTYHKLLQDAEGCEVVLFGEIHGNPLSHWLELQLTKDLFKLKKQNLILGAEMFEADHQGVLNRYLKGEVSEDTLQANARLWQNYGTDYKPLVEFARNTNLEFVATNIPRYYAAMVYDYGFEALEALTEPVRSYVAPLPIAYDPELDCYSNMLQMSMGGQVSPNLPKAQAIKDATMAHFIRKNLSPGKTLLHFNGTAHSDFFEGIMWYLKNADPYLKVLTVATVEQSDLSALSEESILRADYILVVPDDMTRTFE